MAVLDAYAVLAFLRDEPAAEEIGGLLEAGGSSLTAVGLAEVLDRLVRLGVDEEQATADLSELGLLDAFPVGAGIGMAAGLLRGRHYHRTHCAVSMADCVAAALARWRGEGLATSDPHLLDVCHAEGIEAIVLPASDGSRWEPPPAGSG